MDKTLKDLRLTYKLQSFLLLAAIALTMLVAGLAIYRVLHNSSRHAEHLAEELSHAGKVKDLQAAIINAESKQRGFLLANDSSFLRSYTETVSTIDSKVSELYRIMPHYAGENAILNNLVNRETALLKQMIDSKNKVVDSNTFIQAQAVMDSISSQVNSLYNAELVHLQENNNLRKDDNKKVLIVMCCGIFICIVLLLIFFLMIQRNTRLRNKIEDELTTAKLLAEDAERAKTDFFVTVTDEIRTPMNGLIGMTSLLMQSELNAEQKLYTSAINRNNVALLSVINNVMDFSRIEAGTLQMENAAFSLRDCIDEVLSLMNIDPDKKYYTIDPALPGWVKGDAPRLRQILFNLCSSSLIATESYNNIFLRIEKAGSVEDKIDISFRIENTGNADGAISAALLPDKTAGGLGVSISARLIARMGGTIKVVNEPSSAVVIIFTIQAEAAVTPETTVVPHVQASKARSKNRGDKKNLQILVVDDNEMNQLVLTSILIKLGYTCTIARNGAEAAAMAIEKKYDLIFMDLLMPVMNGIDATARIRQYYLDDEEPVIVAVTANAFFKGKENLVEAGLNDFIIKPYKIDDIKNVLKKWIKEEEEVTI
ncbi:MAG: response regulator [Filimonas sp.]|nr:response regulator [Filimonas sp.]